MWVGKIHPTKQNYCNWPLSLKKYVCIKLQQNQENKQIAGEKTTDFDGGP